MEGTMTFRITTYESLQAHLASANSAVMLCRVNIEHIEIEPELRRELAWRVCRQIKELEALLLHLERPEQVKRAKPRTQKDNRPDRHLNIVD